MRLNIVKVEIGCFESFAGICCKEAFIKALGTGMRYGSWQDIEIYHDEWGAPLIRLQDTFKDIYETSGYTDIHVSISHCKGLCNEVQLYLKEHKMNILTTEDARFIDREVPKQLGISLEILMENAGRGIVDALWGEYDLFS